MRVCQGSHGPHREHRGRARPRPGAGAGAGPVDLGIVSLLLLGVITVELTLCWLRPAQRTGQPVPEL